MNKIPEETLALLIPIIAIILGSALLGCFWLFKHLRRSRLLRAYHEEAMAALAKGVTVPTWPDAILRESDPGAIYPGRALLRGLIWTFVGVATFFAIREWDRHAAGLALIPIAIGLAYLTYFWIAGRKSDPAAPDSNDKAPPLPAPAKV